MFMEKYYFHSSIMARPARSFSLPVDELSQLQQMLTKGKQSVRSLKRAQVLLQLQQGKTPSAVAQLIGVSPAMVYNIRNRYRAEGLTVALSEKPRPGQPSKFDKAAQAHLTALACSQAPDGRSRWTLRLLADRLVELRLVESISHQAIGEQLKKINLSPGSSNNGVSLR
jgi:putative transposase